MHTLNIRDFRSNMASSFNRVDAGEEIFIRRNSHIYAIVPVSQGDLSISPALEAKIQRARESHLRGDTIKCPTHQDLDNFLESL